MTIFNILFISIFTFLTSRVKSFKVPTIDNENSSQAIKATPSGIVNDKESITIYLKNDDIVSISEFSKFYNPEDHHQTNFRFIKETDNDFVKINKSKNDKTSLGSPELEEYIEENKTDRSIDDTVVDSKEESRKSKSEGLLTETNGIESTTIKGQGKTNELIEGYENDLDSPEHVESTERYLKNYIPNDEIYSNNKRDDTISSRRSLVLNEKLLYDNNGEIRNKSGEIEKVDQDAIQKSDIINSNFNDENKVESTTEAPLVAPEQVHPYTFISQNQFNSLPASLPTMNRGLSEISHEETTNFGPLEITPDEYRQGPTETPFVAPQQIKPHPVISQKQSNNLSPLPTMKTIPLGGLSEILNEETTNFGRLEITPDEYRQSPMETPFVAPQQLNPHLVISQKQSTNLFPLPTVKRIATAGLSDISNEETTNFGRLEITPDEYKQSPTETSFVERQQIHPNPQVISQNQFNRLSPLPTVKRTGQTGLSEISNEETPNFGNLKITPDEYKQSNNLDTPGEISTYGKSIDDYNSNIYENAYLYTPPKIESMNQQPLRKQPNFDSLFSKLTQASDHPYRNRVVPFRQHFGNYGAIVPNFYLQNPYLQNFGRYNFVHRARRHSSCYNCNQNRYEMYRH